MLRPKCCALSLEITGRGPPVRCQHSRPQPSPKFIHWGAFQRALAFACAEMYTVGSDVSGECKAWVKGLGPACIVWTARWGEVLALSAFTISLLVSLYRDTARAVRAALNWPDAATFFPLFCAGSWPNRTPDVQEFSTRCLTPASQRLLCSSSCTLPVHAGRHSHRPHPSRLAVSSGPRYS